MSREEVLLLAMGRIFVKFFEWYERYTEQNTLIATGLFFTQVLHLIWLALFVIATRLTGHPIWQPSSFWETLIILFDYVEIPAIVAVSLLYVNKLRKNEEVRKSVRNLLFLNSQWLHIFWITDEFVVDKFSGAAEFATVLPVWLAWIAILIDYLEVPVMYDTAKQSVKILRKRRRGSG